MYDRVVTINNTHWQAYRKRVATLVDHHHTSTINQAARGRLFIIESKALRGGAMVEEPETWHQEPKGTSTTSWNCAMRWELTEIGENPMKLVRVRGASKRRREPVVLGVAQLRLLLKELNDPFRTMVILDLATVSAAASCSPCSGATCPGKKERSSCEERS